MLLLLLARLPSIRQPASRLRPPTYTARILPQLDYRRCQTQSDPALEVHTHGLRDNFQCANLGSTGSCVWCNSACRTSRDFKIQFSFTHGPRDSSRCADLVSTGPRTENHHGQNKAARDLACRVEEQDRKYKLERGLKTLHKGVRMKSDEQASQSGSKPKRWFGRQRLERLRGRSALLPGKHFHCLSSVLACLLPSAASSNEAGRPVRTKDFWGSPQGFVFPRDGMLQLQLASQYQQDSQLVVKSVELTHLVWCAAHNWEMDKTNRELLGSPIQIPMRGSLVD